jgi:signal-transduction protein with cAMP-binding, CBS, and nucleotidyltransferase domain
MLWRPTLGLYHFLKKYNHQLLWNNKQFSDFFNGFLAQETVKIFEKEREVVPSEEDSDILFTRF